jgi:hypothetical protein
MKFSINEDHWYSVKDTFDFKDFFTYKKIKTNKQITYYNDVLAFDIETSSFNDYEQPEEKDHEVYEYLKGTKIKISQNFYSDIPDFNDLRKSLFGRLYFSKSAGVTVDTLYMDLAARWPYYFDEDIINPSDQLEQIISVFCDQSVYEAEYDTKRCVMYVWQLAINGTVIIGRTWEEFIYLINQIAEHFELNDRKRMIIFVHNLSFELAFIAKLFQWDKVFAISARKPIYALTTFGIEFRCSYMLSGLSLYNVGLSLHTYRVKKMVGELDYSLIRHSETPLTGEDDRHIKPKTEIGYCCYDVLVVSAFIKEAMEADKNDITRLPLTVTGYCRNYVRKICLVGDNQQIQFNKYHDLIKTLKICSPEEYEQLRRAFMGGFTHCSALHSFKTLTQGVTSFDLCSAYPAAMCLERIYPMSKGKLVPVNTADEFRKYLKLYACIFDIKFINIKPKVTNENYISISKCFKYGMSTNKWTDKYNVIANNGRLVSADEVAISITNIDYEIIEKFYSWDRIELANFRIYQKGYLPKEIIMAVLHQYKLKTELKGVAGQEDFYQKSKGLLNACYGMICTNIVMPIHSYDNELGWVVEKPDTEKALKSYNNSKKRFLYYPWALFVTAAVRRTCLSAVLACGDDYCYSDTDSCKILNSEKHESYFKAYNRMIDRKIEIVAKHYDIPADMFRPKTKKGVSKVLGYWENETPVKWKVFRSLGAKRYLILTADNELIMTVSGVNKKAATPYLIKKYGKYGVFQHFNNDLEIPAEYTGKLTHYYLDDTMEGIVTDYKGHSIMYKTLSGIYLENTSYSFSIESDYMNYLKELRGELI